MKTSSLLTLGILGQSTAQMYKKVKMKDVDVLTLYQGKMTNARRSAPIPQLQVRFSKLIARNCTDVHSTTKLNWTLYLFSVGVGALGVRHLSQMLFNVITKVVMGWKLNGSAILRCLWNINLERFKSHAKESILNEAFLYRIILKNKLSG